MGLAVTEMGGILLPVEVVTMVGKGEWFITGQLGDVMRKSVIAALSYIRSRASELDIDPAFQESIDLHIHLPENAIPKDGPSAGITIATALISVLSKRPVRNNLAMTGEVTLLGHVLGIGGLRDKVLAAQQANIQTVIIPMANKKDLADIPMKVRQQINLIPVENMDQVIERALCAAPAGCCASPRGRRRRCAARHGKPLGPAGDARGRAPGSGWSGSSQRVHNSRRETGGDEVLVADVGGGAGERHLLVRARRRRRAEDAADGPAVAEVAGERAGVNSMSPGTP